MIVAMGTGNILRLGWDAERKRKNPRGIVRVEKVGTVLVTKTTVIYRRGGRIQTIVNAYSNVWRQIKKSIRKD